MEKELFKRILHETLLENGFKKKGSYYYKSSDEITCAIGAQKSSFSNSYYIVDGLLLKATNPEMQYPKYYQCDLDLRFGFSKDYKSTEEIKQSEVVGSTLTDCIDLEELNDGNYLKTSIDINIKKIEPLMNVVELRRFFERFPIVLNATNLSMKRYLGYNV